MNSSTRIYLSRPGLDVYAARAYCIDGFYICACNVPFDSAIAIKAHASQNTDANHSISFRSDPLSKHPSIRKRQKKLIMHNGKSSVLPSDDKHRHKRIRQQVQYNPGPVDQENLTPCDPPDCIIAIPSFSADQSASTHLGSSVASHMRTVLTPRRRGAIALQLPLQDSITRGALPRAQSVLGKRTRDILGNEAPISEDPFLRQVRRVNVQDVTRESSTLQAVVGNGKARVEGYTNSDDREDSSEDNPFSNSRLLLKHVISNHGTNIESNSLVRRSQRHVKVAQAASSLWDDIPSNQVNPPSPAASNCLIDDDLLRSISCAINPMYRIIICLLCCSAIPPQQLINHRTCGKPQHHSIPVLTRRQLKYLETKYDIFPDQELPPPRGHTAPIAGLSVRHDGFQCQLCGNVYCKQLDHMSRKHPHTANRRWESGCSFQQLFPDRRRYFRVYPGAVIQKDYFNMYLARAQAALELRPDLAPPPPIVSGHRANTGEAWPELTGWPKAVEGYHYAIIADMVLLSRHEPIASVLKKACHRFLILKAEAAQNAPEEVRRWLLSDTNQIGRKLFKRVSPKTLDDYGTNMAQFCCCIMNSLDNVEGKLPFTLTDHQRQEARDLLRLCEGSPESDADFDRIADQASELCYQIISDTHSSVVQDPTVCPVQRFLLLLCLREGGRWLHPRQVSPIAIKTQYWMRLVAFARMLKVAGEDLNGNLLTACLNEHQYINESHVHAFSILRGIVHLASHLAFSEPTESRFTSEDNDTAFTVDGDYITLTSLRDWVALLVVELRDFVYQKLFFGKEQFLVSDAIKRDGAPWIKDEYSNSRDGYSFMTDKANPFLLHRFSLAKYVMNDPELRERFCVTRNGKMTWKRSAILAYLSDCEEAWTRLASCMQVTGGLPQRGREMALRHLVNTFHRLRSIYMLHRRFTNMGFYSKKSHNSICDDILLHWYPDELSDIALNMTVVLRSFEIILAAEVYEEKAVLCYKEFLYAGMGKPLSPQRLSDEFANHSMDGLGVHVNFSLWRQISEFLRKKHCRVLRWIRSPRENADPLHSQTTSSFYGREAQRIQTLTDSKIEACQYMSAEWHYFLRQGPAPPLTVPIGMADFFGDEAVEALASLAPAHDEMSASIALLEVELAELETLVHRGAAANATLRALTAP